MTHEGLTEAQRGVVLAIQREADATGMSPSFSQLCEILGVRSKSVVSRHIEQLVDRGWIGRTPNAKRSLTVLRRVPDPNKAGAVATLIAALTDIAAGEEGAPVIAEDALKVYRGDLR